MEQPKRESEKDEEPVSSYWYDQEALDEAAGRRSHTVLHGSCGSSAEGSVISFNFATYIEDRRRGRC